MKNQKYQYRLTVSGSPDQFFSFLYELTCCLLYPEPFSVLMSFDDGRNCLTVLETRVFDSEYDFGFPKPEEIESALIKINKALPQASATLVEKIGGEKVIYTIGRSYSKLEMHDEEVA